jgi:hypothetical protein
MRWACGRASCLGIYWAECQRRKPVLSAHTHVRAVNRRSPDARPVACVGRWQRAAFIEFQLDEQAPQPSERTEALRSLVSGGFGVSSATASPNIQPSGWGG